MPLAAFFLVGAACGITTSVVAPDETRRTVNALDTTGITPVLMAASASALPGNNMRRLLKNFS